MQWGCRLSEETKLMHDSKLSMAVRMDLEAIQRLVEYETGYPVISKNRQAKFIMAKRIFVKLIDLKYDLRGNNVGPRLITKPLLAEYMKCDHFTSINHLLNNFEVFLRYSGSFQDHWGKLHKLILGNSYLKLKYLQHERVELTEKLNEVDRQILNLTNEEENHIYESSEKGSG